MTERDIIAKAVYDATMALSDNPYEWEEVAALPHQRWTDGCYRAADLIIDNLRDEGYVITKGEQPES